MAICTVSDLIDQIGATVIHGRIGGGRSRIGMWKLRGLPDSREIDRHLHDLAAERGLTVNWSAVYADKPSEAA